LDSLELEVYDAMLRGMPRDERELRYNELELSVPLVFLLSIVVSFISVRATEYYWFLALLVRPVQRAVSEGVIVQVGVCPIKRIITE
jgi:hypothetical protein